MTADCRNLEIVIPDKPEIVNGALANLVKGEIVKACFCTGRLESSLQVIHGLPAPQEDPARPAASW